MLYELMPLRMAWCLEHEPNPKGLRVLDLGCGGGLSSAAFARLGAQVVGVDMCPQALAWARSQTDPSWDITYIQADVGLWTPKQTFDVVLAMEMLEHSPDPFAVIHRLSSWLEPGGSFLGSTLNRTALSSFLGLFMAERVLKWVPKGTHQWKDFITPAEMEVFCAHAGFVKPVFRGVTRKILKGEWQGSSCLQVNYFFATRKCKALGQGGHPWRLEDF